MNRVVHFEIQSADPELTGKFYSDIFGWKVEEWKRPGVPNEYRYWIITTGSDKEPGINGGILFRKGPAPEEGQSVNSYTCTIQVHNLDETIVKVLKMGGNLDIPRMPVNGIGWLAYCKDIDGNIFGIIQYDKKAK